MKIIFCLLIALEIFLGCVLFGTRFYDDWDLAAAIANYTQNPTPATKAVRDQELRRVRKNVFVADVIVIAILAANTLALYRIGKKIRTNEQPRGA